MIQSVLPESAGAGAGLFWNPAAISYLSQLLIALVLSMYLGRRLRAEHRLGRDITPTLLFGIAIAFLVPALLTSLLYAMAGGGWMSYVMPWISPASLPVLAMPWVSVFTGGTATTFTQFAYRFPQRLPGAKRERTIVGGLMACMVIVEIFIALRTDSAMLAGDNWARPDWAAWWMNAAALWMVTVFARQYLAAQRATHPAAPSSSPETSARDVIRIAFAPATSREAKAARGVLIFTLLPVMHTTALVLQQQGFLGPYSIDILLCWSVLAQLTGFTLVYISYLPERSSFLFKLTSISAALLLAAINGTCWIIAPGYFAQFRAPGMVTAGQEIRFSPNAQGSYAVGDVPLSPDPVAGRRIGSQGSKVPLPFTFPFYGRNYQTAYVSADGTVAFDHVPRPAETVFRYGSQPTIYPLLVAIPKSGTDVRVRVAPKRLIVTRRDRCVSGQDGCYGFQTVLHANGRIDFAYLAIPAQPRFQPFEPLGSPWLMGITPGNGQNAAANSARAPLIRDYHREFLTHVDSLYAPLVPFLIGALVVLMVGLPRLLRGILVRPLARLLGGMKRFRDGDLGIQVPVSFNDEIGYLTESFNAMARSQHGMVHGLETMVAQRVAEVTDITARNAQLEERNRLSADLHDSVSQTLFSAALLADALPGQWRRNRIEGTKTLERLGQLNRDALSEMRLLLTELRNGAEEDQPPGGRITALVAQFEARHGMKARVEISGDTSLPAEVRTVFHRITQESLNNIAKHAQAANVRVAFEALPGQALLIITDDGQGFDPTAIEGDHLGLQIMQERARRIGATLEIETAAGKGTTTTLVWMRDHGE